jgi:hypothetical protein
MFQAVVPSLDLLFKSHEDYFVQDNNDWRVIADTEEKCSTENIHFYPIYKN